MLQGSGTNIARAVLLSYRKHQTLTMPNSKQLVRLRPKSAQTERLGNRVAFSTRMANTECPIIAVDGKRCPSKIRSYKFQFWVTLSQNGEFRQKLLNN